MNQFRHSSGQIRRLRIAYDPVQPRDTFDSVENSTVSVREIVAVQTSTESLSQRSNTRHPISLYRLSILVGEGKGERDRRREESKKEACSPSNLLFRSRFEEEWGLHEEP